MSRLEAELVSLFGRETVEKTKVTSVANLNWVDADYVRGIRETLKLFSEVRGQPLKQRAIAASLDADKRLVLCMWLLDRDFASKLIKG